MAVRKLALILAAVLAVATTSRPAAVQRHEPEPPAGLAVTPPAGQMRAAPVATIKASPTPQAALAAGWAPAATSAPANRAVSEEEHKAVELRERAERTSGAATYVALFVILFITGFGLPLPEEIPLLLAGYLARHGAADLWLLIPVGIAGALSADLVLFLATKRWRNHIFGFRFMRPTIRPRHLAWVRRQFHDHGLKIVVVARWLPALRTAVCITAGLTGVRPLRFIVADVTAACITVPVSTLIGYFAAGHIDRVVASIMRAEHLALAGVIAAVVGLVLFRLFWWPRLRGKRPAPTLAQPEATPSEPNVPDRSGVV